MTLTARQKKRIDEALPAAKAKLRATYNEQNSKCPALPISAPSRPPGVFTGNAALAGNAARRRSGPQRGASPRPQRIPNFLNPMVPIPVPCLLSEGMALPHTSLVSHDFTVGTATTKILVVSNVGNSATVGFLYEVDGSGLLLGHTPFVIPTVASSDSAGGPSSCRAMKFSCSVVNCSNALKRGGRVTYLNSSQRLPALGSVSLGGQWDFSGIISGVKSSPYRRRIMGGNLAVAKQLIGFPVDNTSYSRFDNWRGSIDEVEFNEHTLGASTANVIGSASSLSQRPMSVICYIFDPVEDIQNYSVTIRASYYTRWPLASVPGQSMKAIPTTTANVINHISNHAEATANDLAHIGEGAAAAVFGPRIASAFGGAVRGVAGAMRAGAPFVEAGEAELMDLGAAAVANPELMLPLLAA